jgi:regulator of RNase E activity RraA
MGGCRGNADSGISRSQSRNITGIKKGHNNKMMKYTIETLHEKLYTAVICDALDSMGFKHQSPRLQFHAYTNVASMVGRCKTTLWVDMYHEDPNPYELELEAVDSCKPGDILIAAASGSVRSGIWGELLSTAARNAGCVGTIVHGAVRDIRQMTQMGFPVFATAKCIYDSMHRQRVVDIDITVEIDGVLFNPGDLVFADVDGIVVIPQQVEEEVIERSLAKVGAESVTRTEIKNGMKATAAYKKYGIL